MHVNIGSHIKKIFLNYLQIETYIETELKSESEIETQYVAACQRRILDCCHQFHQIAYINNILKVIQVPHILFDLIMVQMCSRETPSPLKNSLQKSL